MVDPQKKARDADRDTAIEVVEAAYADGQITQADCELRVERLLRAVTVGEVTALVRDLRAPTDEPKAASWGASLAPRPPKALGPKVIGVVAAIIGVVVLVGMAGTLSLVGSGGSGSGGGVEVAQPAVRVPDLTGRQGWNQLVDAVEAKTGSTVVWSATVYPRYAVVEVPVDGSSERSFGWYYDGRWSKWTGKGQQLGGVRNDLAEVDGAVVARVVARSQRLVEDPTTSYVIVDGRGRADGTCFSAYAANDFDETAYVDAACDGRVTATVE